MKHLIEKEKNGNEKEENDEKMYENSIKRQRTQLKLEGKWKLITIITM